MRFLNNLSNRIFCSFLFSSYFRVRNIKRHSVYVSSFLLKTNHPQYVHIRSRYISPSYSNLLHTTRTDNEKEEVGAVTENTIDENHAWIIEQGKYHGVAYKPPSNLCHHSEWTGSKAKMKRNEEPIPMLQRIRDTLSKKESNRKENTNNEDDKMRINLIHRLDRGASGLLLFAHNLHTQPELGHRLDDENGENKMTQKSATALLAKAMQSENATKTYVALVRGSGMLKGENLRDRKWFRVDRPVKDENGQLNDATTYFRFVAGIPHPNSIDDYSDPTRIRASLVLARPHQSGRWHQIRRHLNGLSHPILGDTSHGSSKTNREWRELRNMPFERTFLHLGRIQIPHDNNSTLSSTVIPKKGIDVKCPLPPDFMKMLQDHMPTVLEDAREILEEEGIQIPTIDILGSKTNGFGNQVDNMKTHSSMPKAQQRENERKEKV